MKKLSIKSLVEFRKKSELSKRTFIANLKKNEDDIQKDGGGHYWITSLSAISNAFKHDKLQLVKNKAGELQGKLDHEKRTQTKAMYERNIAILDNYEDFDLNLWRPSKKLFFHSRPKADSILTIKGLEIEALPQHVFSFGKDENKEIGGIWFIANLKGHTGDELGMFVDILYRYLNANFSNNYAINPNYCLAVDVVERFDVSFSQLEKGEVKRILIPTVNEIIKLM